MEEISLKRKGPLIASKTPIPLGDLQVGDAIVAFSRRDVLDMRAELVRRGRRVAVVYGALSPEVRRAEAARFRDGDADILVATDAIGMGLNLPIRRVIFSTLRKFDGEQRRELNTQEVKQIGGRAGRYGRFEEGVVAVLAGGGSPEFIKAMLEADPMPPEDPRPLVQPEADIIANVAQEIGSDSLFGVLARIKRAVLRPDDPNYRLADLTQAMAVASAIDGVAGMTLLERWTYAMCPVDERDNGTARLARWAIEHGAGRPVAPPTAGRLSAPERAAGRSWNAPRRPISGWSPGAGWRCASRMPMSPATRPMAKPSGWTAGSRTCCASSAARSWSPDALRFRHGRVCPGHPPFPYRGAARRPGPSDSLMPFPALPATFLAALTERGYAEPTPVQAAVLEPATAGRDLLVSAQTGSGKTVAFGLAMAAELMGEEERLPQAGAPLALVVAPTRELALQVQAELAWLYAPAGGRVVSCVGGTDPIAERRALARGAHIVVGTPGRLRDHLERGNLDA